MRVVQRLCRTGPEAWIRRRIVDIAVQEWAVFGFQTVDARLVEARSLPDGVLPDAVNPALTAPRQARAMVRFGGWEDARRFDRTIAGYWSATPAGARVVARQNRQWRSSEGQVSWVEPWSAAFVSWVVCEAGLAREEWFARDIAHWTYLDQAIRAADDPTSGAAYRAHDPGEAEIAPGDLLCNSRGATAYRRLADRRPEMGRYAPAHCDIVVRVGDDRVNVIGGNVVNGVTLTILPLIRRDGGHPRPVSGDDLAGARSYFAHLKLRGDPVEPNAMDQSPTIRALR